MAGEDAPQAVSWESLRGCDRPEGELALNAYLDMPEPVPTGVPKLDQLLGGGMARGVTVVGGASSAGKTVLACMSAAMMAARGQRVVYASYETAWEVVQLRCASAWSATEEARDAGAQYFLWSDVVNGRYRAAQERYRGMSRQELSRYVVGSAMDPVARTLTLWDEGPGRNLAVLTSGYDVHELCEAMSAVEGQRPVLVVDYIQIVPTGSRGRQDDNERVTEVMGALREYSYSPRGGNVLALSSLRKLTQADRRDSPTMDWFRGSNHVGYDAEQAVILTLDYEDVQEGGRKVRQRATADDGSYQGRMTVVKNRTGATGTSIPTLLYGWCSVIA